MPRRLRLLLALGVVVLAACGDDGAPDPAPVERPPTAVVRTIGLALDDVGARPRRPLTLSLTEPQRWVGDVEFRFVVEPGTVIDASGPSRLRVGRAGTGGEATAEGALGPLQVAATNGSSDLALRATFASTLTLDAHRRITDAESTVDIVPALEDDRGAIGPVDPALAWFLLPMPDEPVGLGATWHLSGDLTLFGTDFEMDADVELVELRGRRFRLAVGLQLDGPPAEGGRPLVLTGGGRVEGRSDRAGPTSAQISLHGEGERSLRLAITERTGAATTGSS